MMSSTSMLPWGVIALLALLGTQIWRTKSRESTPALVASITLCLVVGTTLATWPALLVAITLDAIHMLSQTEDVLLLVPISAILVAVASWHATGWFARRFAVAGDLH